MCSNPGVAFVASIRPKHPFTSLSKGGTKCPCCAASAIRGKGPVHLAVEQCDLGVSQCPLGNCCQASVGSWWKGERATSRPCASPKS